MHRVRRTAKSSWFIEAQCPPAALTLPLNDRDLRHVPSGSSENMMTTPYTPRQEVGRKLRGEQSFSRSLQSWVIADDQLFAAGRRLAIERYSRLLDPYMCA